MARLVLHVRGIASPISTTTNGSSDAYISYEKVAKRAPKSLTFATDEEQYVSEQHLSVSQPTHQDSHGANTLEEHSVGDEEWRHKEGDAVEMDMQKTSSASKVSGDWNI